MILSFFSLGSCPSKKCQKVAHTHTVALTDSASMNVFLKEFWKLWRSFLDQISLRIRNPVSDLAGGSEVCFFFWRWTCKYSYINSDKIRTLPQLGPRNAWIGNPHKQNCMVEVGTLSLPVKVHPEKNCNQKNSTVIDREFDLVSITVEFFGLRIFL